MDALQASVHEWITDTGLSPNQMSRRAGVSQSTMSRVLSGRVDPTTGTLTEIALACGLELDFNARPASSPDAARAARALLETGYPDNGDGDAALSQWKERLPRYAGTSDPVEILTTAARYACPQLRPGGVLFAGEITVGQIASAGDAANGHWAVSGAAGLTMPEPHEMAPAMTILWSQNPRSAAQLLADSNLRRTDRPTRATVAVLAAEPALFTNTFSVGIVKYAAPLQIMLDCLAQGGDTAATALEEVPDMVTAQPGWAISGDRYLRRRERGETMARSRRELEEQYRSTGITWESFDVTRIPAADTERSRHRFRAELPELIWNTAALEGNTFTLPEVRTLLDNVTVGGRPTRDAAQILALSAGYNRLDELVGAGRFALTKTISDELHALVAVHEAIESGHFRGEGRVDGGGAVRLAGGGVVEGTPHGPGGSALREHFDELLDYLNGVGDARERALLYFASATRRQFYFDGNKRTARLMMTGALMAGGYDLVSIPFARKLELNNALDTMFSTDDATELLRFLTTCTLR